MTKQDLNDIISVIDNEINGYDIEYDYEIEDNWLTATFKGMFTGEQELSMTFRCSSGNVELEGQCESFIEADTRSFWIEFMSRISN